MTTKFVTVEIENRPGELGRIARCLGDRNVNIEGFESGPGVVNLLTNDPEQAVTTLRKEGFSAQSFEAFEIQIPNRPGQLATVGEALAKANVNIEGAFGTARDGRIYLRVDKPTQAKPVLAPFGVTTVETGSRPARATSRSS